MHHHHHHLHQLQTNKPNDGLKQQQQQLSKLPNLIQHHHNLLQSLMLNIQSEKNASHFVCVAALCMIYICVICVLLQLYE